MRKRTRAALVGMVVVTVAGASAGIAFAVSADDETEAPITGQALQRATAAALQHTGGGRVTGTEVGDEESYYEVEVTQPDGRQVDVQLDRDFAVVGSDADAENDD